MQKISGILPSTPRIASVDLREGHAARPGGPTFGRPEGSSGADRRDLNRTTAQVASEKLTQLTDARTKAQAESEIVKRLSDGFFMRKTAEIEDPRYDLGAPGPDGATTSAAAAPALFQDPESGEMVEGDLMPPGSYVDVAV